MSGAIVWLTGLPASGKSTLATHVAKRLRELRRPTIVLDGDEVRAALVPSPGYDEVSRDGFYSTLGNLAGLAARQGMIVIVPATAHRRRWRDRARLQAPRFVEVHVATPLEECRRRDPRGIYAAGSPDVPGVSIAYEPPLAPEVIAPAGADSAAVDHVLAVLGISAG